MSRVSLGAPISGWLTSVHGVPDPVFSEGMMGVGIAIDPPDGTVVAPCPAKVLMVAPTRHSVTLQTEGGAELLIHIGIDTVALEGRGFQLHVRDGDQVSAGDPLISFDLDAVGLAAKSLVTPILLTNADQFRISTEQLERLVDRGDPIGFIEPAAASIPPRAAQRDGSTREAIIGFE